MRGRWGKREEGRERELRLVCKIKKTVFFLKKNIKRNIYLYVYNISYISTIKYIQAINLKESMGMFEESKEG